MPWKFTKLCHTRILSKLESDAMFISVATAADGLMSHAVNSQGKLLGERLIYNFTLLNALLSCVLVNNIFNSRLTIFFADNTFRVTASFKIVTLAILFNVV